MPFQDTATGIGGVSVLWGAFELGKLWLKRRRNGNGDKKTSPMADVAIHLASMASSTERHAEAVDGMRDVLVELRGGQTVLLRALDKEVMPKLDEISRKL